MDNVRRAQNKGLLIFAETCPQYLNLTWNDLVSILWTSLRVFPLKQTRNASIRPHASRTVSMFARHLPLPTRRIKIVSTCEIRPR